MLTTQTCKGQKVVIVFLYGKWEQEVGYFWQDPQILNFHQSPHYFSFSLVTILLLPQYYVQ